MDVGVITTVVGCAATVASAGSGLLTYRFYRRQGARDGRAQQIDHRLGQQLAPVLERVKHLEEREAAAVLTMKTLISEAMEPFREQMAVANSKLAMMDEFWRQIAWDAAKILHQPHPERREVDELLEAFMAGTLTPEQESKLRRFLLIIRNWEPGQDVGFPVHPGEQTAAAILLRTMHHSLDERRGKSERRGQGQGSG